MQRLIERELLDELPAEDPRAVRSRRDVRRLNVWMGHVGIMQRILMRVRPWQAPARIVELGAGDGTFLLRLARNSTWRGLQMEALLVDRQDLVSTHTKAEMASISWQVTPIQADVFDWLEKAAIRSTDVIIANLFLHHFSDDALRTLFKRLAEHANLFFACEPRRSRWVLGASKLVGLIGCNEVTRYDAAASVCAGFVGKELSTLWPQDGAWELTEEPAGSFTHTFVAQRSAGASRTF